MLPDPEFRCSRCLGTAPAIDEGEDTEVGDGNEKLEVVSQSSATLGTCSLREVVASWLQSQAANTHSASSANCFPSDQMLGVLRMCEECDAACSRDLEHEGGHNQLSPA